MTESNIAGIRAAVSISDLRCVKRAPITSWPLGCERRCAGVSAAWGTILIWVINSPSHLFCLSLIHKSQQLVTLCTSTISSAPASSSHPSLTLYQASSRSLSPPRRDLNLETPDSIRSVFFTQSGATRSAGVWDERRRGWWEVKLPGLVVITLKHCCHQAQRPYNRKRIH